LRPLKELTERLRTRAEDSHATPVQTEKIGNLAQFQFNRLQLTQFRIQGLVRLCALYRIEPHAPPLVQTSVNFFEF
jgi:hypothetical protein